MSKFPITLRGAEMLREELKRRDDAKEQIVTRRVTEITGERGELDF